jgi:ATP-binding cassette subfamily B protein
MGATVFFWRKVYPRYYRFWDAASNQAGALTGLLRGVRVVKFFGQEERETKRFDEYSRRFMRHRQNVDGSIAVFNGVVGVLFQLGGWFVWYFGGSEVIGASLSLGELMAFFGYMWMFYGPLAALPQLTSWLTQFATQTHRIFEILDTPVTLPLPVKPVDHEHVRGRIDLEQVTFSYESHKPVLEDLDLVIEAGETIGLVGGSGSGKSTLVNLLCRLYDVEHGHVRIDGIDVRDYDKRTLRRSIGVVPQETILFSGTIVENIAYGDPEAPLATVLRAADAAQCHSFVLGHPLAYDTMLGENGTGLSGGERQRIGIARALLTDPPILVLDEATSNVDPASEAAIQAALDRIGRGKTTIAIAHRLSALRNANRIVVMDGGRISEIGAPAELLERGGSYAKMVRLHGLPGRPVYRTDVDDVARALAPLDPERARILVDGRRGVLVEIDGQRYDDVFVVDCFPISRPGEFLSLQHRRDESHADDLGLVIDPSRWPADERLRLQQALQARYLVADVDDEFYLLPPADRLARHELEMLQRYADW